MIGILGGGLIGQSWASLFLAHGQEVVIVDSDPTVPEQMRAFLRDAWPNLRALGLAQSDEIPGFTVSADIGDLVGADWVQENAPDRIAVKRDLIAQLEQVIAPDVVIASSSSSLMPSDIQRDAHHPDRILVAHPMNPPHMVPMVELVAGAATRADVMDRAEAFYLRFNRVPIRVRKEVPGHLANRLTAALYREAVYMVAEGIADVADIDKAIAAGPGMRWALMGPHLIYHLGGGAGGYAGYLDHLGPTQEARWQDLGHPVLDAPLKARLVEGLDAELSALDQETLRNRRDAALVALAQLKRDHGF